MGKLKEKLLNNLTPEKWMNDMNYPHLNMWN
jgi:hypothetical protein